METKKKIKAVSASCLTIFKIRNRQGYAALCKDNLTEGNTPFQAYQRMQKALKRNGFFLKDLPPVQIQKIVRNLKN